MKENIMYLLRIGLLLPILGCSFTEVMLEDEMLCITAESHYEAGEYNKAAEKFSQAAELSWSSRIDDAHYGAAKAFRAMVERNDTLYDTLFIDSALTHFEAVDQHSQHGLDAWYKRADLLYLKGKIADSLALEYKDESYELAYNLAITITDQWPSSERTGEALLLQGHVLRKFDRDQESIVLYEQVTKEYTDSRAYDNALYWCGDWYWSYKSDSTKKEQALECWSDYVTVQKEQGDTLGTRYKWVVSTLEAEGVEL